MPNCWQCGKPEHGTAGCGAQRTGGAGGEITFSIDPNQRIAQLEAQVREVWATLLRAGHIEPADRTLAEQVDLCLRVEREIGRKELRELMNCGHPKACWVPTERIPASYLLPEHDTIFSEYCSACERERAIKVATIEAIHKEVDAAQSEVQVRPEYKEWTWDEVNDLIVSIKIRLRALNPDDIKVGQESRAGADPSAQEKG